VECDCVVQHMPSAADSVRSKCGEYQYEPHSSMNILWIVLGIGIVGVLAKRVAWPDRRAAQTNLGFVSQQWLADHRLSQVSDPNGDR
jgi:hypothetical protein